MSTKTADVENVSKLEIKKLGDAIRNFSGANDVCVRPEAIKNDGEVENEIFSFEIGKIEANSEVTIKFEYIRKLEGRELPWTDQRLKMQQSNKQSKPPTMNPIMYRLTIPMHKEDDILDFPELATQLKAVDYR
jgi:hypothetical protein